MTRHTRPHRNADDRELVVSTYNVQKGFGTDFRRDPRRTQRVIAELGADLLAVQEGDRRFGSRAGVLDLDRLAEETGLRAVPVPKKLGHRAHGWHGNLLFARAAEVEDVRLLSLPGLEPRGALVADLRLPGQDSLRVIAAHLALLPRDRRRQAEVLLQEVAEDGRPTLLIGDLNDWRHGPESALAALMTRFGTPGAAPSYPAPRPRGALDRIYASPHFGLVSAGAHVSPLSRKASDHLPVVARLRRH